MEKLDRRISILAVDYTDLALGLGDTKAYLSCLDFSSAQLRIAWAAWQKMSTSLIPEPIEHGKLDAEMGHLAGLLAASWLRRADVGFRYIQIHGKLGADGDIQEALLLCKGDFQQEKPNMEKTSRQVEELLGVYGIKSPRRSGILKIQGKSREMSLPMSNPQWREWCQRAFENRLASQEKKD